MLCLGSFLDEQRVRDLRLEGFRFSGRLEKGSGHAIRRLSKPPEHRRACSPADSCGCSIQRHKTNARLCIVASGRPKNVSSVTSVVYYCPRCLTQVELARYLGPSSLCGISTSSREGSHSQLVPVSLKEGADSGGGLPFCGCCRSNWSRA